MDLPPKAQGERSYEGAGGRKESNQSELEKGRALKKWKQGPQKTFRDCCGEGERRNKIAVGRGHGDRGGMLLPRGWELLELICLLMGQERGPPELESCLQNRGCPRIAHAEAQRSLFRY